VKRSSPQPRRVQATPSQFRLSPVAAGATVMLMAMSAQAQQTPDPSTQPAVPADAAQTITVTGIRRGIENAINVKKNADGIVEAVSAEDIGKLPDVSIAESIARLPGLSAQRVAGRAQVISVRGLSPDFATTLLNGRELVSTGDNRSVEFDQYPSELLSGVTVYKTPDAGLIGQGLSGTLDMQTVRPLNFGNRVISLNARGSRNSLGSAANADANGNRFSVSYIDQFADRTVGVTIGFAHQDTPTQENQVGLYEPWKVETRPGVPAGTFITDGIKALRRTGYTKRDGLMGTIEFRPSKAWTSTLDLFYSKAKQEDTANQFEVNLSGYNNNISTITPPAVNFAGVTVNGNKTLTASTAENIYPLVRGIYNKREDEISAFGFNNKFTGDHGIRVSADISYSKANRNELSLENNQQLPVVNGTTLPLDNLQITGSSSNFTTLRPGLDYSALSSLRLTNTIYGSGYGKVPSVKDELTGFKLVASLPASSMLSVLTDIDVGVNFADRSKKKRQPEGAIFFNTDPTKGPIQGDTAIGSDLSYGLVNLGFAGVGSIPAWNVPAAVSRYMTFSPSSTAAPYLVAKSWDVNEQISTAFIKAGIDADLGGVNMRGNVGLQFERVSQSSAALQFSGDINTPTEDSKSSSNVLPSLNLAFALAGDQTVRVALARQVARPRVDDLRASIEVNAKTANAQNVRVLEGNGGNPQLEPWKANAFDLSYEKYFGSKAYVAAAYFYKDLKTYIFKQTDPAYDFTRFVPGVAPVAGTTINPIGSFARPANGKGGKLQGVELTASVPFELLTPALKGFGIVASASFNKSNIQIKDPDSASSVGPDNIELPGLSKRVFNLTAYYERGGFEARISQRRRSDFIGEIGNFNGSRTLRYVAGENVVDAQLGYNFNEGSLKGLGLLFQVNNLTDSAYRTYHAGNKDRPLEYTQWGRSYLLGANYKF
jgi:iron complex outermembrane recepter protein